jgi:hypothetical protein
MIEDAKFSVVQENKETEVNTSKVIEDINSDRSSDYGLIRDFFPNSRNSHTMKSNFEEGDD